MANSFFDDEPEIAARSRQIATAATGVAGAIVGVGASVARAGNGLTGSILGLGASLTGAVAIAAGALTLAIRQTATEMTAFARQSASMRAQTGMSYAQSGNLLNRFGAFGIGGNEVQGMFANGAMNPLMAGMRGGMMGVSDYNSPRFISDLARAYQQSAASGPLGRMMANANLDTVFGGQAPDSVRSMVNLPLEKIQAQQAWQERMQGSLGVTPNMMRAFAEDIPLLQNRIGSLWSMIKVRFAGELAPLFERVLGNAADYLSKNAGKIAESVQLAARWLIVESPALVMGFASGVMRALGTLLKGGGAFLSGMAGNASGILKVFDTILNGARFFASVLAGVATAIGQVVSDLYKRFGGGGLAAAAVTAVGVPLAARAVVGGIVSGTVGGIIRRVIGGSVAAGTTNLWAAPTLLGRVGQIATTGGAGAVAGATGLGLAGGTLAGYGLYRVGQATGLIDPTQSFGDRMATGWGRLRDLATGNIGHYDRMVQAAAMGQQAQNAASANGLRNASMNPMGAFMPRDGRSLGDAFSEGRAAFNAMMPQSNLEQRYGSDLSSLLSRAGSAGEAGGDKLLQMSESLDKKSASWRGEMIKALDGINGNTRKTADNTGQNARSSQMMTGQLSAMQANMIARIASYTAEDAYMNLTRIQ